MAENDKKNQYDTLIPAAQNVTPDIFDKAISGIRNQFSEATVGAPQELGILKSAAKTAVGSLDDIMASRDLYAAEKAAIRAGENYLKNKTEANKKKYDAKQADYLNAIKQYEKVTGNKYVPKWEQTTSVTTPEVTPATPAQIAAQDAETARENRRANLNKTSTNATVQSGSLTAEQQMLVNSLKAQGKDTTALEAELKAFNASMNLNGGGGGNSVSSAYQLLNEQQVAGFANQISQQLIGRGLTPDELANATSAINAQAKANPTITRTNGGSTVQSGGIDERQVLKEQLQLNPEYENYQKATTYFDSMLSALRGPVGGGI